MEIPWNKSIIIFNEQYSMGEIDCYCPTQGFTLPYNHLFQFIEASYFMVWYIATIVLYLECELDCNETDKPYRIVQAILRPVLKHSVLSTVG